MGILNVTPDSFHDGGQFISTDSAIKQVEKMMADGADIIDIGAQSTRPNAKFISANEEWNRLENIIPVIRKSFPKAVLSVDTFWSTVAQKAVDSGIDIINDISAGSMDKEMFTTIAMLNVPYILMHMQGTPQNMQVNPTYTNVMADVIKELSIKIHELRQLGMNDIIVDPGFGFGKTTEHNYELLKNLGALSMLELPVLVGVSRKSMINRVLKTKPAEALNGTTTLHAFALDRGVNILRVHDVKEAKEVVSLYKTMMA